MIAELTCNKNQEPFLFQVDRKVPLRFAWASLIFIYVLQYPLSLMVPYTIKLPNRDLNEWLVGYTFILISVFIFMSGLAIGLSGKPIKIYPIVKTKVLLKKRMSIFIVIFLIALFAFWSYLMMYFKIGMTIYAGFEPLPYRITGFLFYGRLFLQPMILAYIAIGYSNSKLKWILLLLLFILGAWASLTSGSRFVGIMFALPMLMLFKGKSKYLAFGVPLVIYIIISTLSRTFYLPFIIGDPQLLQIYGTIESQESATRNVWMIPIYYIINRPMGMAEVLMTINFGDLTPSFADSLQSSLSYFTTYISPGSCASVKNVYGLSDDVFGGYGLDLFSNFWVAFGGSPVLYMLGMVLIGWLLGKTYRQFSISLARLEFNGFANLIFVLLFMLIFEARGYMFPYLLLLSWFLSRKNMPHLIYSLINLLSPRSNLVSNRSK
ncbi:MAG: hypothetical protein COA79_11370 [Planctomycetota bacterium]|nr:MAG: hypothetical protein COA79_11370 [Planctomycetota bacterium]